MIKWLPIAFAPKNKKILLGNDSGRHAATGEWGCFDKWIWDDNCELEPTHYADIQYPGQFCCQNCEHEETFGHPDSLCGFCYSEDSDSPDCWEKKSNKFWVNIHETHPEDGDIVWYWFEPFKKFYQAQYKYVTLDKEFYLRDSENEEKAIKLAEWAKRENRHSNVFVDIGKGVSFLTDDVTWWCQDKPSEPPTLDQRIRCKYHGEPLVHDIVTYYGQTSVKHYSPSTNPLPQDGSWISIFDGRESRVVHFDGTNLVDRDGVICKEILVWSPIDIEKINEDWRNNHEGN